MRNFYFVFIFSLLFSSLSAHDPLYWKLVPFISYRYFNSVQVLDINTIILAGGNEKNDAIRDILRSTDGGENWDIILDNLDSSWLKSLYFTDGFTGFAVGYNGAIIKTTNAGQSWSSVNAPANVSTRNFNSIFFINEQTGFIAGGNSTNDSLQTILKTTDGGNSWTVIRDAFGYWLNGIYFSDASNGFAVGDNGVALKTTDGGNNWNQMTLPGNVSTRDFNTVFFLDANTGFIGGGNKTNDSIQTILKTTDGGSSWNIIHDNISPWITAIHFPIQFPALTTGFAVGDKGTVLITEDAGDTWNQVAIPDTTNDTVGLRSVFFLNLNFGVAAGRDGKILVYKEGTLYLPSVSTNYASNLSYNSATLNGTVNSIDNTSYVAFEYGTTRSLGSAIKITATPDSVFGNTLTSVSADITGLNANTIYYFRVTAHNINGTAYGEIKQFYTGGNAIPNWDFESWDTISALTPLGWLAVGNVARITSYDGSYAIALTGSSDKPFSGTGLADPRGTGFSGGVPFAARPDSLIGYFKYNVAPGDSARIILFFKKHGIFNSQNYYYITGSSGSFQRLGFPITFNDSDVPDSLILGIFSTDIFGTPDSNSMISTDNISFSGTALNVPNHDLELWDTVSTEKITLWHAEDDESSLIFSRDDTRSSDSQHGNFAARLENTPGKATYISTVKGNEFTTPSFAVHARHATLTCYLKYFPDSDSLTIYVSMFKNHQVVGTGSISIDTAVLSYTPFVIPFQYTDTIVIPDSATINITVGSQNQPHGNSVLYIDNLGFDGFHLDIPDAITVHREELWWKIFPNPAENNITLSGTNDKNETVIFSIIDLNGKVILENKIQLPIGKFNIPLDLKNAVNGTYIVTLQKKGGVQFKKLVIGK